LPPFFFGPGREPTRGQDQRRHRGQAVAGRRHEKDEQRHRQIVALEKEEGAVAGGDDPGGQRRRPGEQTAAEPVDQGAVESADQEVGKVEAERTGTSEPEDDPEPVRVKRRLPEGLLLDPKTLNQVLGQLQVGLGVNDRRIEERAFLELDEVDPPD